MSSLTVSISGTTSNLRSSFFPPLLFKEDKEWDVALLDFTTYNSIPNIIEGVNNKIYYSENTDFGLRSYKTIELETGSYEIEDINSVLQNNLGKQNINLKANNNLLKSEITSKFYIDFSKPASIGALLGFSNNPQPLIPNTKHIGVNTVNIIKVNVINITCNIVHGAFKDGVDGHIIHSFYPTVAPGFKIVEKPHNLVYLPLNVSRISDINLIILDQDNELIDFRGETITVRLHIKQR